ncbi:TPA: hypothetical protein DEG21_05215 [Patescibacteria group bacterium]|nr:hypothetical protein [Candidatus Gracilibacteria bacterium]HBY75229.1 hypothetical protein [Candidatus Gracilibacteria bacterium]
MCLSLTKKFIFQVKQFDNSYSMQVINISSLITSFKSTVIFFISMYLISSGFEISKVFLNSLSMFS